MQNLLRMLSPLLTVISFYGCGDENQQNIAQLDKGTIFIENDSSYDLEADWVLATRDNNEIFIYLVSSSNFEQSNQVGFETGYIPQTQRTLSVDTDYQSIPSGGDGVVAAWHGSPSSRDAIDSGQIVFESIPEFEETGSTFIISFSVDVTSSETLAGQAEGTYLTKDRFDQYLGK